MQLHLSVGPHYPQPKNHLSTTFLTRFVRGSARHRGEHVLFIVQYPLRTAPLSHRNYPLPLPAPIVTFAIDVDSSPEPRNRELNRISDTWFLRGGVALSPTVMTRGRQLKGGQTVRSTPACRSDAGSGKGSRGYCKLKHVG